MAKAGEALDMSPVEAGNHGDAARLELDDDGRPRRTGNMWTASAHIITAVIGAGVLSLAWAMAQLGWGAGLFAMVIFAAVSYYTSTLLAECYRSGDPVAGKRNYTYTEAVRTILGGTKVKLCGVIQYANLVGIAIGYTIASSISMLAIKRADCFHDKGHKNPCRSSSNPYMILFGAVEIFLSQIPDLDQIWWLSIIAAAMSFTYATIGLSLGIAQTVAHGEIRGSLAGVIAAAGVTPAQKVWRSLQAFGNISFAYSYAYILIEIQDTIRAPPPSEATVMKRATMVSVATTTAFYMLCGCMGYAAFGGDAPDNLLTGFGFLRALLAPRRRQRRHRRAPRRRVPGVRPAALRLRRGAVAEGEVEPGGEGGALRPQRVPARVAHGVRLPHHRHRHVPPLLRRRRGAPRSHLLLAALRLLPRRDVHRAARRAKVEHAVGLPPDAQRRVPPRVRCRRHRLHGRCHRFSQAAPAVQFSGY